MIDAHCHLDLPAFEGRVPEVLERARCAGVVGAIVAGVDPAGWERQRCLSAQLPQLHVTYGVHPWAVAGMAEADLVRSLDALDDALGGEDGVSPVGLGELGLDRGRRVPKESVPLQLRAFRIQLAMARDRNLPVVLHVVQAHGLALEVVADDGLPEAGGMVHGFGGSAEVAAEWVRLGAHVSFSTAIARGQSRRLGAACGATPAHRLLVETDAPDQAPTANGRGVNEPANLVLAVEALAALRGATVAEIGTLTAANTRRLFGLAGLY